MEKSKVLILKNPIMMALIVFITVILLSIFITQFLHVKLTLPIELLLIIFSTITPILYNLEFQEQISKRYRVVYSTSLALFYTLFSILIIHSLDFHSKHSDSLIRITVFASLVVFLCVYIILEKCGNLFIKLDLHHEDTNEKRNSN